MADLFNVVFSGDIVKGAEVAAVRANIARIFNANDAVLDRLFSGQRVVVKKAVDQATAMKLRAVMRQAGANAAMEACDAQGKPLAAPATPSSAPAAASTASAAIPVPPPAPAKPASPTVPAPAGGTPPASAPSKPMTMAERLAALAAEDERKAAERKMAEESTAAAPGGGAWKLAPAGARLAAESDGEPPPPEPDISGISMARARVELLTAEERESLAPEPVEIGDISDFAVMSPSGDLLQPHEKETVVPVEVDISSLSMSGPNTEVLAEHERAVVVPVVVDVSGLSVAALDAHLKEKPVAAPAPPVPDTSHLKLS